MMTIVWIGWMHALFESVCTSDVNGSHCGGGFFVVSDGGRRGSCISADCFVLLVRVLAGWWEKPQLKQEWGRGKGKKKTGGKGSK
jgi:hypothetical protein